jgi:excisionase family DNA binding protein
VEATGRMTIAELRGRTTVTIEEAGDVLGVGRGTAYECAQRGEIPTLQLGRRLVVPVPLLLSMLGDVHQGERCPSVPNDSPTVAFLEGRERVLGRQELDDLPG